MTTFVERLKLACERQKSLLCVGLDPDSARMPVPDVLQFNRAIIDATADLVCAYKPNLAFYEALGLKGLEALKETVEHIRKAAPDVSRDRRCQTRRYRPQQPCLCQSYVQGLGIRRNNG